MRAMRMLLLVGLGVVAGPAAACDGDATALFACEAANGRKFIELCGPSPMTAENGFLVYRFGAAGRDGYAGTVELEFPEDPDGSLRKFVGATYTHQGTYTQSVRFVRGGYSYRVFTAGGPGRRESAGVAVRERATGKTTLVACSERPRFYIFDLKGLVGCDPETPVGAACIE